MPSKPTIPRRNSGNRATPELIKTNENNTKYQTEDDINFLNKNDVYLLFNLGSLFFLSFFFYSFRK